MNMNAGRRGSGGGDHGGVKRRSPKKGVGKDGGDVDDLVSPLFYEPSPLFHPCECYDEEPSSPSHEYEYESPTSERHHRRNSSGVFAELSGEVEEDGGDPSVGGRPLRWQQKVFLVVLTLCIASVLIVSSSGQSLDGVVVSVHNHDAFEEHASAMGMTAAMTTTRTTAEGKTGTLAGGDEALGIDPPKDQEEPVMAGGTSRPSHPRLVDISPPDEAAAAVATPRYYRPGRAVPHQIRAAKIRTSADYREDRRGDDLLQQQQQRGRKTKTTRGGGGTAGDAEDAGKCVPRVWQTLSHPTCSFVHEVGHLGPGPGGTLLGGDYDGWGGSGRGQLGHHHHHHGASLIGVGTYRYTWAISTSSPPPMEEARSLFALKTLRFSKEFTEAANDRHRRDALISERLTSSPHVVDIYGYCGSTAMFEFATGGTLADAIRASRGGRGGGGTSRGKEWTGLDRLRIAADVAAGVADLHGIDGGGHGPSSASASVAHADVKAAQFVRIGGTYKLNDFNMAQFLGVPASGYGGNGTSTAAPCKFLLKHKSKTRAPEERRREPQDEKVDVYNLGNVLNELVVGQKPRFGHGGGATLSAIAAAVDMCHVAKSTQRPSAREVSDFLSGELRRLGGKQSREVLRGGGG